MNIPERQFLPSLQFPKRGVDDADITGLVTGLNSVKNQPYFDIYLIF